MAKSESYAQKLSARIASMREQAEEARQLGKDRLEFKLRKKIMQFERILQKTTQLQ